MAFISLLVSSATEEEDAIAGIELLKSLGEKMKPNDSDSWMCLLDSIISCMKCKYQNAADLAENTLIRIFETRRDIPDCARRILVEKFVSSFFNRASLDSIVSILSTHDEYSIYWKETVPFMQKLVFESKEIPESLYINIVVKYKEEIAKEPQLLIDATRESLKNFAKSRQLKHFIESISSEFADIESVAGPFNEMLTVVGRSPLSRIKEFVKARDFNSADSLFNELLVKHHQGDHIYDEDLIEVLDFISSLSADDIRNFSKGTLKQIVKLVKDNDASLRNSIEPILEKLI